MEGGRSAGDYEVVILVIFSSTGTLITTVSSPGSKEVRRTCERWSHRWKILCQFNALRVVKSKNAPCHGVEQSKIQEMVENLSKILSVPTQLCDGEKRC